MAAATGGRTLEETPTWAVAVVCIALVLISIVIEHIIHLIGQWLRKKRKTALYEALEKIKSELMLLGFISLLLTVGQGLITNICISEKVGSTWHPCSKKQEERLHSNHETSSDTHDRRKLLSSVYDSDDRTFRRFLAAAATGDKCAAKGKVPFVSAEGIHQLHIFIFVLAVFHVLNCIFTMALGRAKMRRWKAWERETRTAEYQLHESLRYMGETSFGRRHLNLWTNKPLLMWIVCFFRHFVRLVSVAKVDYLTLRHGFIMAHMAPQSHVYFDFRRYIKRSLEDDFKVVVGISPLVWFLAVVFLLSNTHGWYSHLWLPFIPLAITVLVGTKLQAIVTKMGLKIEERGEIVKGVPVVQPGDDLFWFNRPRLMLYLINFILFQNAFQLAFFTWTWYEFGIKSCFHDRTVEILIRISIGILVQFLCSYITLPLYALVTQMGSTMKPSIFNERVAMALRNWHNSAKKHIRESRRGGSRSTTPRSSQPTTPSRHTYLTWQRQSSVDSHRISPRRSSFDVEKEAAETLSLTDLEGGDDKPSSSSTHGHGNAARQEDEDRKGQEPVLSDTFVVTINEYESEHIQHETEIESKDRVPETLPPMIPSQECYRASTSSDHRNIPGGGENGECQEPAILTSVEPVSELPSMQHEIDIESVESASAGKGVLKDGREDYQEVELVDGLDS